jgi:hypothetical protein
MCIVADVLPPKLGGVGTGEGLLVRYNLSKAIVVELGTTL